LGYQSIFADDRFSCTATTMDATEVCFLDKKLINSLIQNNTQLAMTIIKKLCSDKIRDDEKIVSLHHKNIRERFSELLLSLSTTHGRKEGNRIKLDINLTRNETSKLVGTSNESLIRLISEFRDLNIIEQKGKTIYINNRDELVKWANIKT
jgi:CRP-like cAMP-binding protein